MLPVNVDSKTYGISFRHVHNHDFEVHGQIEKRNGTICTIFELSEEEIKDPKSHHERKQVAQASAILNPVDNFRRPAGRKLSLRKALHTLGLSKEQRQLVWDQYVAQQRQINEDKVKYRDIQTLNALIGKYPTEASELINNNQAEVAHA